MEALARKYRVNYSINTFELEEGEPKLHPEKVYELESETDNLHYLFHDLSELHQGENVFGLKIITIQPL